MPGRTSLIEGKASLLRQSLGIIRSWRMYCANPCQRRGLACVYARFVRSGDLCFDIGSHIGSHTSVLLTLGARVVAVEPQAHCMDVLKLRFGRNDRVALLESAVGDTPGRGTLFVSQRTPTVSTLCEDWIGTIERDPSFSGTRWELRREVSVVTLDDLIARFGEPAFCKIDVEGAEAFVLRGLSVPIPAVSFEYIPVAMGRAIESIEALDRLGSYEYNWSVREGRPLESPEWLNGSDMKEHLCRFPAPGPSGDVFARLAGSLTNNCGKAWGEPL